MIGQFSLAVSAVFFAAAAFGQPGETLHYNANWPSGASFGEGLLRSVPTAAGGWDFELTLDASLPGLLKIVDRYSSKTGTGLCSVEFVKESEHGPRKTRETTRFDQQTRSATRTTHGGGTSRIEIEPCAKDALAYLNFVRREFAQGRVPPLTKVLFGAVYEVRLRHAGARSMTVNGATVVADHLSAVAQGPASEITFELILARDAARTPLAIRAPFSVGTFSLELTR
ncbi:MAG: DUF3108 domain-containing protein [Bryobacterales bacterium]|nr:DUF3108 domain-containing protein [Bryobacterales bacterium]